MIELARFSLFALIAYGHIKLYFDDGKRLSPVKFNNRRPYGFAEFWDGGRFVSYIDLRQY